MGAQGTGGGGRESSQELVVVLHDWIEQWVAIEGMDMSFYYVQKSSANALSLLMYALYMKNLKWMRKTKNDERAKIHQLANTR